MACELLLGWKKDLSIPFYGFNKRVQDDPLTDGRVIERTLRYLRTQGTRYQGRGKRCTTSTSIEDRCRLTFREIPLCFGRYATFFT